MSWCVVRHYSGFTLVNLNLNTIRPPLWPLLFPIYIYYTDIVRKSLGSDEITMMIDEVFAGPLHVFYSSLRQFPLPRILLI